MKIAVFPGSFDPVTIGHQDIIARASKLFDRVYVSIVPNGTKTHPMFSDEQKLALMRASVEDFPNVEAELGGGLLTDYALRKNAQFLVRGVRNSVDFDAEQQLSLIYRDVSEGALETVLLVAEPKYQHISSTMVREMIFPGSFDPVTIGHQDIIARASKLFDRVYVSIVPNGTKTHPMFSDEQKLALMRASVEDFPNVEAELGGGLLTDYALRKNAQFLVRGVRNSVDFDAEQQLSLIYRDVSEGALETVLLVAEPKYQHISSTMVREMIKYGQNLEKYMPLRAAALVKEWGEDHGEQ